MNLFHRLLLVSFTSAIALQVTAQKNPLHAYLPSDAKVIINVNLSSLATKLSWADVQKLSFFEEALKEAPLQAQEFLNDPASSGIDFRSDFFIVVKNDSKSGSKTKGQLYGSIADLAKFTAAIQKMSPKQPIKKAGNINMLLDQKNVIAWTPEIFVMPFPSKETQRDAKPAAKTSEAKLLAAQTKEWLTKSKALLTPVTNPLSGDQRFMELAGEAGDIRLWVNRDAESPKTSGKKSDGVLKMMNLGVLQQGNHMAGVLRFEQGKAVMQMKSYMNKTMDSLYKLYPASTLNNNLLRKFPGGQPVVLLSFSLSPEMLGAIVKASGAGNMLDSLSKKSAVKPMELMEGLNGDITLAVIRAHEFEEKDTVTAALNGVQVFLAASVKNKAKIQPLIEQLQKPKENKKEDDGTEKKSKSPFGNLKPSLLLNDSFFVISISSFAAEKFLASTGNNEITELASPYISHSSLFALDLKTIINFAMQMSKKKSGSDEGMAKMQESFDKIILYGGKYDNGAMHSTFELLFTNKQENGLKQFMTFFDMAAEMERNKIKSRSYDDMPVVEDKEAEIVEIEKEKSDPPPPAQKAIKKKDK